MRFHPVAAALTLAATAYTPIAQAVAPAPAPVQCSDSATAANSGFVTCVGPLRGNIAPGRVNELSLAGYGDFELAAMSDDDSGVFSISLDSARSGTVTFASAQTGLFALGLKGGPTYSVYLFDGGSAGITSLDFDTYGITTGGGRAGPGLSHAALFTSAVPEPGSALLLLAGLSAVGFVARRRTL